MNRQHSIYQIVMNLFCVAFLLMFFSSSLFGQYITNVRAEPAGEKVNIYYDIKETKPGQTFNVKVECSTDGGGSYGSLLQSVTGDIHEGVRGGSGKSITWDVLKDRHELVGDDVVFKVTAYPHSVIKKSANFTYELLSCKGEGRNVVFELLILNHTNSDKQLYFYKGRSYILDNTSRQIFDSSIELAGQSKYIQLVPPNSYCKTIITFEGVDPLINKISTLLLHEAKKIELKNILIIR